MPRKDDVDTMGAMGKQISIRLDLQTLEYFRALADELGIPYQTLINMYLRECAEKGKRPSFRWTPGSS